MNEDHRRQKREMVSSKQRFVFKKNKAQQAFFVQKRQSKILNVGKCFGNERNVEA